jgi:hypothetical protein
MEKQTPPPVQDAPKPNEASELVVSKQPLDAGKIQSARTESINELLSAAYKEATRVQLSPQESEALREPFDDSMVRGGAKGDEHLLYISHIHVSDRMNDVLGVGAWALIRRDLRAENCRTAKNEPMTRLYFEGVLVIRGSYVWEAVGVGTYHPNNPKEDYGSALESAMSDCLTRCCKRLGIGSQTWDKGYCEKWLSEHRRGAPKIPPPRATAPANDERPSTQEHPQEAPTQPGGSQEQDEAVPEGCQKVTCAIVRVEERKLKRKADSKEGSKHPYQKGDPFSMWKIETENDGVFSTFSSTDAVTAANACEKLEFATIVYKEDGQYKNVVSIN